MPASSISLRGVAAALLVLAPFLPGCQPVPQPPPPSPPPSLPRDVPSPPAPVVLVQPSSSVADAAERNYYRRMAGKLADWLRESGLPVTTVDDEGLPSAIRANTRAVIVCSSQHLGFREWNALSTFLGRGGKLVVFNAADPRLATAMGMSLGARLLASRPGQWSAFRLNAEAPTGAPARILQDSPGLRPVFPASGSARVMAWWEDSTGRQAPQPAWVRSDQGFWMSHMLLEGDIPAKKTLLIALLASCDPAIWPAAASQAIRTAGTLRRFADARQALAHILQRPCPASSRSAITALHAQAEQLLDTLARQYRLEHYDRVMVTARLLDDAVMEAFARTASSQPGELRALWNHSGVGLYPGDWSATCQTLARHGMNAIFPNVQRPWSALYASPAIPPSPVMAASGDQLAACIPAARRHNIEVHAWAICWNLEGAPASLLTSYRRQGRLQVSATGTPVNWLCPSDPRNRAFQAAAIRELAERYPLNGIHLDYLRYPSKDSCFCDGCRQRFIRDTRQPVKRWPADVLAGPLGDPFRLWRRAQLTTWLAGVRQDLRRIAPGMRLSVAVYPGYPGCRDSIGQDWGDWARADLVDLVCPMNYTGKTSQFEQWCSTQAAFPSVRARLVPGIGVTANESRLNAADVIDQIAALRRHALRGFLLFDANRTVEQEILPFLSMGATAD